MQNCYLKCCAFLLLIVFNGEAAQTSSFSIAQQIVEIEKQSDQQLIISSLNSLLGSFDLTKQERIQILESIESHYKNANDYVRAIEIVNRILLLAEQTSAATFLANTYKRLGIYHYLNGDFELSIVHYHSSLSFIEPSKYPLKRANLYNNIGLAQTALGYNSQAIASYQSAEKIYQQFGTELDKIDIRFNIAGLYLKLERYDTAIKAYENVIARREAINDLEGLALSYSDLGIAYKQSGKPEIALEYMEKSLAYFFENNDLFNLSSIYHNLSDVYFELGQHSKSIEFAEKSISISEVNGYNTALSGALHSFAKAQFYLENVELALEYLLRSDEIAKPLHYAKQIENNLSLFSLIYATLNQPEKALSFHRSYLNSRKKRENDNFNILLAGYESEQLKQQVIQLQQKEKLQQLNFAKEVQERNFTIIAVLLIFLVTFLIYRRNTEKKSKLALVSKVKQRTKSLELLTEKLQEADKVKSLFLANMSHEIRTPLTAIIAQSEALLHDDLDEALLQSEVAIIHNNSLHLLELINNILDLSKVEANKLELDIQPQDLHEILQDIANMFCEQAKKKDLSFEISHNLPSPFIISMDGFRVKQILINLCSNAIKFTSKGHVNVFVTLEDAQIVFSVEDTGIGLSSSQIELVFESFTQGDSSISRRFGGTGLGLCLSQQLAQLMKGNIEISSILNQGSTFSFILPCEAELTAALDKNQRVLQAKTQAIVHSETEVKKGTLSGTILLAEDHQDNRILISRLLSSLGLKVYTAANGKEAVKQYIQHQPQVILMDIQMPEMDGIEAHSIMRQKGAKQPIIALTANAMSHEVDQYLAQGFDDHLKKPIDRKIFIQTISQYYQDDICAEQATEKLKQVDMQDLVEQFKSNLVLEQQDIILHLKNENYEKLSLLVHRMAGAAQMFGFSALSEHAITLEQAIKAKKFASVNNHSQALLNEIDQILW
ncbi:tetratricopeptide repeat protein [Colwelliaceae bacterium 6441]